MIGMTPDEEIKNVIERYEGKLNDEEHGNAFKQEIEDILNFHFNKNNKIGL